MFRNVKVEKIKRSSWRISKKSINPAYSQASRQDSLNLAATTDNPNPQLKQKPKHALILQ